VLAIETPLYVRGLGGFQIEECVVVTANGYELLTTLPRSVIEVASA
jgi:Xaa-Pro aminopeptidase